VAIGEFFSVSFDAMMVMGDITSIQYFVIIKTIIA
jgi:hypothetical protein